MTKSRSLDMVSMDRLSDVFGVMRRRADVLRWIGHALDQLA